MESPPTSSSNQTPIIIKSNIGRAATSMHTQLIQLQCSRECSASVSICRADVALINSGTFRSDAIHPPGRLTMKVGREGACFCLAQLNCSLERSHSQGTNAVPASGPRL